MDKINLTDEERIRFIAWLDQEAEANNSLANQLGMLGRSHQAMGNRYRLKASSCILIAKHLRDVSTEVISSN